MKYSRVKKAGKTPAVILMAAMVFICACSGPDSAGEKVSAAEKNAPAPAAAPVFNCISPGRWFPADGNELSALVDSYLGAAEKKETGGKIIALISPHAGYQFSGPVAGYAYKQLEGADYDLVVVVGFSHSMYEPGVSVYTRGSFRTPLGNIPIDEDAAKELVASHENIVADEKLFSGARGQGEHSVENQLPFLQRALKKPFRIVPVMFGSQTEENAQALGHALAKLLKGKNALIVASTDMSHFWPYEESKKLDAGMIELIKNFDVGGIAKRMEGDESGRQMCGHGAVRSVLIAAKLLGADRVETLKSVNSQDTSGVSGGDRGVVGYLAAALVDTDNSGPAEMKSEIDNTKESGSIMSGEKTGGELSAEDRKEILGIARESLETFIRTGGKTEVTTGNPALKIKRGMFVTLEMDGRLRGCMGHFEDDTEIGELAASQALVSATHDPRFPAVTPGELDKIDIELSILSVPEPVDSYEDIVVGKHGVILRKSGRGATFLPQVAPEQGWDRDTMLSQLSRKAGLSPDAWKEGASFMVYTAEVFGEKDGK